MKERKLGLLGRKIGMTRIFDAEGASIGVTVLEMGPCVVLAKRSAETNDKGKKDGYSALQLGFDPKPEKKVSKPEAGHVAKAGGKDKARRYVRELRVNADTLGKFSVGQDISLADLEISAGDRIDVSGRTKGKGFQGVMKRHHFAGFRATHGTHEYFRHGGSIGCRKWPGRVFKGRKMPGHMGDRNRTTQNIKVVDVRPDDNLLLVAGSVPGKRGAYVMVRPAIKKNPLP